MAEIIQDKIFGELKWESMMNWWIGEHRFNPDLNIWISIYARDRNDFASIKKSYKLFENISKSEHELKQFAFSNINELALDEDLSDLSAGEFCNRLSLESIIFNGVNDGCEVAFADGDIFGGHIIVLSLNKSGKPIDARIEG